MSKCKICRSEFVRRSMTHKVCSPDCGLIFAKQERERRERSESKKDRLEILERRQKLKSRSDYLKEAQIEFNRFIRERDSNLPCISCGRDSGAKVNAGHYLSVGSAPQLRFNENNCHKQCEHCNTYLSGNQARYRIRLISKIGLQAVEELESDQTMPKWTIDDLKSIKMKYKEKTKQLQNQK